MRKYIICASFWLGTICAVLALFARGLDMFGKNFIDFNTGGGGIGFHSLMDATLFFLAISFGNSSYRWLKSEEFAASIIPRNQESFGTRAIQTVAVRAYWLGSVCGVLGCLSRGLDLFGKNFIDFSTRGSGIGYHSMMDGTLFFYAISAAHSSYLWLTSQERNLTLARNQSELDCMRINDASSGQEPSAVRSGEEVFSSTEG